MTTAGKGLDAKTRNTLDSLVPKLRKLGSDRLLRIEGHDGNGRSLEDTLNRSLLIAKDIQVYLVSRHNINLDVYLATATNPDKGRSARIYACPKQFVEEIIDLSRNLTDSKRDGAPPVAEK